MRDAATRADDDQNGHESDEYRDPPCQPHTLREDDRRKHDNEDRRHEHDGYDVRQRHRRNGEVVTHVRKKAEQAFHDQEPRPVGDDSAPATGDNDGDEDRNHRHQGANEDDLQDGVAIAEAFDDHILESEQKKALDAQGDPLGGAFERDFRVARLGATLRLAELFEKRIFMGQTIDNTDSLRSAQTGYSP